MAVTTASSQRRQLPSLNPFATCNVRPGAIPFHFPTDVSADVLVDRLELMRWRAQILGPHGSGKTTLLKTLLPVLVSRGRDVAFVDCSWGQRSLPRDLSPVHQWTAATLLVVDGFEQLGFWTRRWLKRKCRIVDCGLLVTGHRSFGLPTLYGVKPQLETIQTIVQQLQHSYLFKVSADHVTRHFADQSGNVRETFFRLYDLYEKRREH
jgi:hypothetical protein